MLPRDPGLYAGQVFEGGAFRGGAGHDPGLIRAQRAIKVDAGVQSAQALGRVVPGEGGTELARELGGGRLDPAYAGRAQPAPFEPQRTQHVPPQVSERVDGLNSSPRAILAAV